MSAQNKYIVTWDIYANTETAVSNIRAFTSSVQTQNKALRTGITNLKEYNAQLLALRNNIRKVGGAMSSTGRQAVGQGAGVFPNTKAAKGYAGWNSMMMPPFAPTPVLTNSRLNAMAKKQMAAQQKAATKATTQSAAKGAAIGGARGASRGAGFVSPLRGTPFGGLMGTLLAYSAISTNVVQAVEYDNLMTTAKSFLKIADEDLTTFEERFDKLSKNVRNVGLATKFTASEVAGATKYLAMAGMDITTIDKSIKPIADLALIGDEDLALIADLSTNIMTGYGLDENSMTNVADIIASTMTRSNVSITEIAESFKMSAGYLSSSGIDFSEATAAIGVLGDAGMKATLAGTALRAMMIRFAKPTKEAKKVLDGFGVSFTKTTNVMGKQVQKVRPLVDIFTELRAKGAGLEDLQRIFGTIGGNAAIQLLSRTEKLAELTRLNRYAHGTSGEAAKVKQENTKGLWSQMTSKFQDQFLTAFLELTPAIDGALRSITDSLASEEFANGLYKMGQGLLGLVDAASKIGVWIGNNWSWIQPFIMGKFIYGNLINIGRGFTSVAGGMRAMAGGAAAAKTAATGLSAATMGWGAVIAALLAGSASLYLNYQMIDSSNKRIVDNIRKTTPDISTNINEWVTAIGNFNTGIVNADGSIKKLKEALSSGETVKGATGVSSPSSILWFVDKEELLGEQVETYLGGQKKLLIDAVIGGIAALDPNASNYAEQVDKITKAAFGNFASNTVPVDYSLYSRTILPIHRHPDYKEYTDVAKERYGSEASWRSAMTKSKWGTRGSDKAILYGGIAKVMDDMPIESLKQTAEFQAGWAGVESQLQDNIITPYKEWMESRHTATETAKSIFGDNTVEFFRSIGLIDSKGNFVSSIKDAGLDTSERAADLINSRNIVQNLLQNPEVEGANGRKMKLDPQLFTKLIEKAGLPSELWSASPLGSSNVDVVSGLSTDDDGVGGAGGSSKGLSGASNQPRQVIVNLDNLLNIESVEIDNTNQDIEIDNIKEKIAQALLDVVADYSASYHG